MPAIVDMHCHVLPGVDDGPKSMEGSMTILQEAVRQGIGKMIVTPHYHPGRYKVPAPLVLRTITEVRRELRRRGIAIELIPGQECYYFSNLLGELDAGNVLTMAGSNFVLVEFDPGVMYNVIQHAVRELFAGGYRPIIAHFERYQCLNERIDRLDELHDHGALLQMNFDRLLGKEGFFRRNFWRRLMREGYVDFLGSDTHGVNFRPLHVDQAMAWMRDEVDPGILRRVLEKNIRMLTDGD